MNAHYLDREEADQGRIREMLNQEIGVLEEELTSLLNEIRELQKEIEGKVYPIEMFSELLSRYHGVLKMMEQVILLGLKSLENARVNIHRVDPYVLYRSIAFWRTMKSYITGLLSFIRSELRLFI